MPGPAKLTVATLDESRWRAEIVEDPDSNVFHKAMWFRQPDRPPGIVTIGGNEAPAPALLKLWRPEESGWRGEALTAATFGHRFNRFRDVEAGDVDGDGVPELVVGTHDTGVVAIVRRADGETWSAEVIDSAAATFVHEIELGDLDGDGAIEIYATPTAPNRLDHGLQPGRIVQYTHSETGWSAAAIMAWDDRHAKEITVADVDRDGRQELLAAVEQPAVGNSSSRQVEIIRVDHTQAGWSHNQVALLPAPGCRSLVVGDIDGDGWNEVVAGCGRTGVWLLEPGVRWSVARLDPAATSVETAVTLGDLDRDGVQEIYVAADDVRRVIRYRRRDAGFDRTELLELAPNAMTFGIEACLTDLAGPDHP